MGPAVEKRMQMRKMLMQHLRRKWRSYRHQELNKKGDSRLWRVERTMSSLLKLTILVAVVYKEPFIYFCL